VPAGVQSDGASLVQREPAPADLKKDAGRFDPPIALGLLLGSGQVAFARPGSFAVVVELALISEPRPIKGVLAMAFPVASERSGELLFTATEAAPGHR
jgi:magnesium chelatase family protein